MDVINLSNFWDNNQRSTLLYSGTEGEAPVMILSPDLTYVVSTDNSAVDFSCTADPPSEDGVTYNVEWYVGGKLVKIQEGQTSVTSTLRSKDEPNMDAIFTDGVSV